MRTCLVLLLLASVSLADELSDLKARFAREKGKTYAERIETVRAIEALKTPAALRFLVKVVEEDADLSMQLNTLYSIARIPLRASFDALLDFYRKDESLRSTIFSVIASYRQEPMPADLLAEALAAGDQGMRSNVIRYLQRRGDDRFIPEAERFLRDFPNGGPSLVSTLTNDMTVPAARLLVRIYDDDRQYDRQQIPKKFAEADLEVQEVLPEAIAAGKEPAATNAAKIAARAGVASAEPALVKAFRRAKPAEKAPLLEAIGAVGAKTEKGRAAILLALSAKDPDLVVAAVRAVRAAPTKEAIPLLIGILARDDRILKGEARVTLERIVGQQYGERVDLWEAWWKEYGPGFGDDQIPEPDPDALDQALVDLAIEKGALALKAIRAKDDPPWEYASHPIGTTSLVVLALHAAGVGPKDRDLRAGLKYLLSAPVPDRTYDTGILAVALETVGGKKYRRRISECARRLISTQLDHGMWGYPTGDGDNSNTQYAVLGLRSAIRAGVKVPQRVLQKVRDHYTGTRGPDGGWSYTLSNRAVSSASMTAAGVSCLLICLENLKTDDVERAALKAGIDRGFDALGEKMKLDKDSLYALYGMERAGVLGSRSLFGGKPWYVPGAKRLVAEQGRDGRWKGQYHPAVDTSFAILFLKKATAPISSK